MALNPHIAYAARQAALNNALALANSGTLVIYSGTQPANADTALAGNTVLSTSTLSNPAFSNATGGSGSTTTAALTLPANVSASATGTATAIDWGTHGSWCVLGNGLGAETMNGMIDDVRVESVVRSAAYIATQYRNRVGLYAAT